MESHEDSTSSDSDEKSANIPLSEDGNVIIALMPSGECDISQALELSQCEWRECPLEVFSHYIRPLLNDFSRSDTRCIICFKKTKPSEHSVCSQLATLDMRAVEDIVVQCVRCKKMYHGPCLANFFTQAERLHNTCGMAHQCANCKTAVLLNEREALSFLQRYAKWCLKYYKYLFIAMFADCVFTITTSLLRSPASWGGCILFVLLAPEMITGIVKLLTEVLHDS
jgi:hypothetical protein